MHSEFTNRLLNAKPGFDFVAAHFECEKDKYSAANPDGYVNFGSAQNFITKELIEHRLDALQWRSEDTPYCSFAGTTDCRSAIAQYLQDISGHDVAPNNIVVGNGLISILEAIGIATLNPGDAVLMPTPIFPGLVTAFTARTGARFLELPTSPTDHFNISPEILQARIQELKSTGQNVKAVLLCSPGNPIGQVFTAQEVGEFVSLAESLNFTLIMDEIYASSCFEDVDFSSSLATPSENVVTVGGLSKDFGLAGYSTGWAHTLNKSILKALNKQAHFFRLPAPIQNAIEVILDPDWRVPFINLNRHELTARYRQTYDFLTEAGIEVTPAQAGLVLWLDLRQHLSSNNEAAQLELYQHLLSNHRVHVSPASGFHCQTPGFFRICFSQQPETLLEGLKRIRQGLNESTSKSTNIKRTAEV